MFTIKFHKLFFLQKNYRHKLGSLEIVSVYRVGRILKLFFSKKLNRKNNFDLGDVAISDVENEADTINTYYL